MNYRSGFAAELFLLVPTSDPGFSVTPIYTLGRERTFFEDLFGNIGAVGAAGMGGAGGGGGPGGGPNGS